MVGLVRVSWMRRHIQGPNAAKVWRTNESQRCPAQCSGRTARKSVGGVPARATGRFLRGWTKNEWVEALYDEMKSGALATTRRASGRA
jgi:hypothetical protein